MTVLPQIERELIAAHARRRGRAVPGLGFLAPALAVGTALAVAAVALVVLAHGRPVAPRPAAAPGQRTLLTGLTQPTAYAAGGWLFVSEPSKGHLVRLDPKTGLVTCDLSFPGRIDGVVVSHGMAWVTTTNHSRITLWRLDSKSLVKLSTVTLPGVVRGGIGAGSIASAGGWIWVGTADGLVRVSPTTGAITRVVPIRDALGVEVAADPAGRVLVVAIGQGVGYIERRDPRSGVLIGRSGGLVGATQPVISEIVRRRYAWITQNTGLHGSVWRADIDALARPIRATGPSDTTVVGGNGIGGHVFAGILWVTHALDNGERSYCADPVSGRVRAPLALGRDSSLLAADAHFIYYASNAFGGSRSIIRAPIDPRCR